MRFDPEMSDEERAEHMKVLNAAAAEIGESESKLSEDTKDSVEKITALDVTEKPSRSGVHSDGTFTVKPSRDFAPTAGGPAWVASIIVHDGAHLLYLERGVGIDDPELTPLIRQKEAGEAFGLAPYLLEHLEKLIGNREMRDAYSSEPYVDPRRKTVR